MKHAHTRPHPISCFKDIHIAYTDQVFHVCHCPLPVYVCVFFKDAYQMYSIEN